MPAHRDLDGGSAFTVDGLVEILQIQQQQGRGNWPVMLRFVGTDEIIIGARLAMIKADGFYQHLDLYGPNQRKGSDE